MSMFSFFESSHETFIKKKRSVLVGINELEQQTEAMETESLREMSLELRGRLQNGETADKILPEAFALVREVSKRTLGQRHFDSQLLGGIILHEGKIAEMKTGEGKTLTATLPVYLNALTGDGVHVVTVNDYLAKRDASWIGQVYHALGLSVGCITHEGSYLYDPSYTGEKIEQGSEEDQERDEMGGFKVAEEFLKPVSRKEAYHADVTYGTNNEFGFDYLRDNMVYEPSQEVQRGHAYAIVDEVDSILIDEARTPLIISAPDQESSSWYRDFARITPRLQKGKDFELDEKLKAVTLTEEGIENVEKILGVGDIYQEKGIKYLHHLEQALRAEALFQKDKDYVVRDGQLIIVDQFTGRLLQGRRFSGGLHQALEAKEGVRVQPESLTLASISFQNYFRMYKKLSGMTGTAETSSEEFLKVYNLEVVIVPTNRPMVRKDLPDRVYQTEEGKFQAVVQAVKECHERNQPVLVGTVSIEKNEKLGRMLEREGIAHNILNAKHHEKEGEIIAQAGRPGGVTVATNMAGRGVDIILGGNPADPGDAEKVKEAGGLMVIGTERHEARRIDNQLRGRSGRQGDPGASRFYVSLGDDLIRVFGGERIQQLMERFNIPEEEAIESKLVSQAIESAQSKVEGMNFDARKHLLQYDNVLNKQREAIYRRRKEILRYHAPSASKEEHGNEQGNLRLYILRIITEKGYTKEAYEKKIQEVGERIEQLEKAVCLKVLDTLWMEHLENMEALRDSVRLRAYGQQDPLVEYKNEGHKMFQELIGSIDSMVAESIMRAEVQANRSVPQSQAPVAAQSKEQKVGRNDLCPCGSGLKYKKCHGINQL
ncbi:MAG: preprotein translocase subunit SecA [bacterium]|nr:preprotein translocase subunit SecA [bacterium]